MNGSYKKIFLLFMLGLLGMSPLFAASPTAGRSEVLQKAPLRIWTTLDRSQLNLEFDSIPYLGFKGEEYYVHIYLMIPGTDERKALVDKTIRVKRHKDRQPYQLKINLPKNLSEWTPQNPFCYKLMVVANFETEDVRQELIRMVSDISFQGQISEESSLRAVYEDGKYAGYDRDLPFGEVDYRIRNYRNKGYSLVRDQNYSSIYRMARGCSLLGLLYEPLLPAYTAADTVGMAAYLGRLDLWMKERVSNASVLHWLLPDMPEMVAIQCRKHIAALDNRPVLMYNDGQLMAADDPLPEPSLLAPVVGPDTIRTTASLSPLHPTSGIDYLYRVNCGGGRVVDSSGSVWEADTMKSNQANVTSAPILVNMAGELQRLPDVEQPIMQSYRTCVTADSMAYHFPVEPMGNYCVEIFLQEPIFNRTGGRMFSILINDRSTELLDVRMFTPARNVTLKLAFAIPSQEKDYIEVRFPKPYAGHAIISAIAIGSVIPGYTSDR